MEITIERVQSVSADGRNAYCDNNSSCDLYVKIFVKGLKVYTTETRDETDEAIFYDTYTTPVINHDDRIRVTVMDYDDWRGGADDEMLSVEFSADTHDTVYQNSEGTITLKLAVDWRPE